MRINLFLFFACFTQVFAVNNYAQTKKLSVSMENVTIAQVLQAIEDQSEFKFFYNNQLIDISKIVEIDLRRKDIWEVLDSVLPDAGITYRVVGKQIALFQEAPGFGQPVSPQQPVTGKVTDEKGNPLPGVTITIKGTNLGALTDVSGKFTLNNVPQNSTLVFSFVGLATQEIPVDGKQQIDVVLKETAIGLDEVVVTGYSTQRKKDIIGAVSIVDVKSLKSIPSGSGVVALQGQASGVNVISNGAPGGSSQIFIRGIGSFGNTKPLVLVDGVEADLDDINVNEVESMQVLKDAGSAAIYGVRGANGVIIITTKKGKTGAPIVTYDVYCGIQKPFSGNPLNLVNGEEYAKLWGIAYPTQNPFVNGIPDYKYRAPGNAVQWAMEGDPAVDPSKYNFDASNPGNNYIILKVPKSGTNWYNEIFKQAPVLNQTITTSGGTDKAKYLFSLSHLYQKGTLIETFLKRYSARINTDFKLGEHVRIGENVYLYTTSANGYSNSSDGNAIMMICRTSPLVPVYDIMGHYAGSYTELAGWSNGINPVAVQKEQKNDRNNNWVMLGNAYAEVDFLKHFTARTSYGGSIANNYIVDFYFNRYYDAERYSKKNSLSESSRYDLYNIWNNTLKYSDTFGKHRLDLLAGSEAIQYSGRYVSGSREDLYSSDFSYLVLGNGSSNIDNSSSAYKNTLFSLFGRLDYSYNDKYLLGLTIRRDGSSKFGADKKYGTFPSVSLGWRISEESFMKNIPWLDNLKIRTSYGVLGSQSNVGSDNAYTLYGSAIDASYYDIGGTTNNPHLGFYQTQIGNNSTSWEKDIVSNFGIDASVLKNKIDFSIEYYKKAIEGLLFTLPLLATAGGANAPVVNIGDIQNTGFDISANYRGRIVNDLNFRIGANITSYNNKVINIPGSSGYFDAAGTSWIGNLVRNQEGHAVSEFFGYDIIGLFQSAEDVTNSPTQQNAGPGRFKYRDVDGDGKITTAERTFIGNPNPKFTYGVNLELSYKNFDLSTVLFGSQGNKVLNWIKWYTYYLSWFKNGVNRDVLNAWSETNKNTTIPIVMGDPSFSENSVPNSFYIEDGSFLKMRSLILGYTFSPSVIERLKISKLRVYFQATNLFQITGYSGLDPEIGGTSSSFEIDIGNYPNNQREYLVGVNLSF